MIKNNNQRISVRALKVQKIPPSKNTYINNYIFYNIKNKI